jgi:hypothetical protein
MQLEPRTRFREHSGLWYQIPTETLNYSKCAQSYVLGGQSAKFPGAILEGDEGMAEKSTKGSPEAGS